MANVREKVEMLAEALPLGRPVVGEHLHPALDHLAGDVRDRSVGPAAVPDHLGRDALPDRALRGRVREQGEVAVAVRVDEPRADEAAVGVDHPARPGAVPRGSVETIGQTSIATSPRRAGEPVPSTIRPLRTRRSSTRPPGASASRRARRSRCCHRCAGRGRRKPVAEEVEAEDDDHDRRTGENAIQASVSVYWRAVASMFPMPLREAGCRGRGSSASPRRGSPGRSTRW